MARDCLFRAIGFDHDEYDFPKSGLHSLQNEGVVFKDKSTSPSSPQGGEAT